MYWMDHREHLRPVYVRRVCTAPKLAGQLSLFILAPRRMRHGISNFRVFLTAFAQHPFQSSRRVVKLHQLPIEGFGIEPATDALVARCTAMRPHVFFVRWIGEDLQQIGIPPAPPQSRGGPARSPAVNRGYHFPGEGSRTSSSDTVCRQLSPKS